MSTIVPNVTNNGTIEVTSGTLDFTGKILGTGSDTISGVSTLQLDAEVSAGQTVDFTGSGGELALHAPAAFAGSISGFDTAGAGSNDTIEVAAPWVFTGFTENAGRHGRNPGVHERRKHHQPHAHRRLQPRRLRASHPSERKHGDNLQRRLWVGFFAAPRFSGRDPLRRIRHPRGKRRERARRLGRRR